METDPDTNFIVRWVNSQFWPPDTQMYQMLDWLNFTKFVPVRMQVLFFHPSVPPFLILHIQKKEGGNRWMKKQDLHTRDCDDKE